MRSLLCHNKDGIKMFQVAFDDTMRVFQMKFFGMRFHRKGMLFTRSIKMFTDYMKIPKYEYVSCI